MKVLLPGAWPSLEPMSIDTPAPKYCQVPLPKQSEAPLPKSSPAPLPKQEPEPRKRAVVVVNPYQVSSSVLRHRRRIAKRYPELFQVYNYKKSSAPDHEHAAKRVRGNPFNKQQAPNYRLTRNPQKVHNMYRQQVPPPKFRREKEYPGQIVKKRGLAPFAKLAQISAYQNSIRKVSQKPKLDFNFARADDPPHGKQKADQPLKQDTATALNRVVELIRPRNPEFAKRAVEEPVKPKHIKRLTLPEPLPKPPAAAPQDDQQQVTQERKQTPTKPKQPAKPIEPQFPRTHSAAEKLPATAPPELVHFTKNGRSTDYSLPDEYQKVRKLGSAGEGSVYLMKSRKTAQLRAIKIFEEKVEARTTKHYPREARYQILYLKDHPFIVQMFSAEITSNLECWVQLEYCNGGTLAEQIIRFQKDFRMDVPDVFVLHVFSQLGEALAYVHHGLRYVGGDKYKADAGFEDLIHGDLKPDNILLRLPTADTPCGLPTIVLADFGMVQTAANPRLISGTPRWMAPEVALMFASKHPGPMTQKSDVYVFGMIMYRMMSYFTWQSGTNPDMMRLPGYEHLLWTHVIKDCVKVNPPGRPEFTTDPNKGLLQVVNAARQYRDAKFYQRGPPDRNYWKREIDY